jgi:hypothetical protein
MVENSPNLQVNSVRCPAMSTWHGEHTTMQHVRWEEQSFGGNGAANSGLRAIWRWEIE